jgi:hypothetical protein
MRAPAMMYVVGQLVLEPTHVSVKDLEIAMIQILVLLMLVIKVNFCLTLGYIRTQYLRIMYSYSK